ncbi:hypothetical protein F4813DRAFT_398564 [Daldinia decipiens]|uniref:uncharacterized protein n=1 Tax=Daldinia decipiens TaxID=326647 RepID=UPI0020C41EB9|nr:uncharacterized protein F4813DRAFT_398564 [Daldinia decipiens]KAI1655229.1 hypothetical protein F4813DRAFT_398564 [Daldinia decipiens]
MWLYKLDPEGDVLLTLHNPDALFAVWHEDWDKDGSSIHKDQSSIEQNVPPPGDDPQSESNAHSDNEAPFTVQFLLSSKHLILASKYFKSTLCGPWKEGVSPDSDNVRHIEAEDWGVYSMLFLMRVIHGYNSKVPRDLPLETLAKIAVLVDYYQCHEAVMLWSDIWIESLKESIPTTFNRDLILWILVAKVFEKDDLFKKATKVALEDCRGELPTLDLPIMEVANKINEKRQEFISRVFAHMYDLLGLLREQKKGCSFECSSILLGALTIQLHEKGILDRQPTFPYPGHSISSATSMILNFRSPSGMSWRHHSHACKLPSLFAHISDEPVEGLELLAVKEIGSKGSQKSTNNKNKK